MIKVLILIMLLTGCTTTIKSPVTQFEYTGYIKQEGVGISVKPPFWQGAVSLYNYFTKEEEE